MGGPEFDLWLSTHRSAGGLGEGSVGGEQRGQAVPMRDRLADALEPATGPDTLTACEVRSFFLLLIEYSVFPYVSTLESVDGCYWNLTRILSRWGKPQARRPSCSRQ